MEQPDFTVLKTKQLIKNNSVTANFLLMIKRTSGHYKDKGFQEHYVCKSFENDQLLAKSLPAHYSIATKRNQGMKILVEPLYPASA